MSHLSPSAAPRHALRTPRGAALLMGALLALLWVLELADTVTGNALDAYGIGPRDVAELPQIYTAPLLHAGWEHLASNSVPFFLLGLVVLLGGLRQWLVSTFSSVTASGLGAWLLSPPNTVTLGASGLVFGWLTYLLVRGAFSRDVRQIALAVVLFFVYGGLLWGVLPSHPGISWQGHLFGALGGLLAAWWLHSSSERRARLGRPRR